MNLSDAPIIIIGMHRSGTSMLSRLLENQGLFLGKHKEKNNEATFFIKLNDWILREVGGRWDTPECIVNFSEAHPSHLDSIITYLKDQLESPRSIEFWGLNKYLNYRINGKYPCHWGWKDPRTTLTLQLWLKIFPNIKILHIKRNGIDVAESLRVRSLAYLNYSSNVYLKRRFLYSIAGKSGTFTDSPRSLSLEGAFSLWESYLKSALELKDILSYRYFEIQYEDLLQSPKNYLADILNFCGISDNKINGDEIAKHFKIENAYKYKSSSELVKFSEKVANRSKLFGY